jgi:hypothetical protein
MSRTQAISAAAAGTITLGGDLTVNLLGYGAMRITGKGIWGPPEDKAAALATLRRAVELASTPVQPVWWSPLREEGSAVAPDSGPTMRVPGTLRKRWKVVSSACVWIASMSTSSIFPTRPSPTTLASRMASPSCTGLRWG